MVTSAPMFGSNDIEKAKAFYDAVLATIGVSGIMEHGSGGRVYGNAQGRPVFSIVRPYDGKPATAGNGTMASFLVDRHEQVDAAHATALALGGRDEGAPGPRMGVHAAYFRDPDGNKICVIHIRAG